MQERLNLVQSIRSDDLIKVWWKPNTCILNCIDPTFEEDCAYSFFLQIYMNTKQKKQ
jgi:hypothetical protein